MCIVTKAQQKYKGVRRIERRPLTLKKQLTNYPENYVHRVKFGDRRCWGIFGYANGELRKLKLIYQ